MARFIRFFLSIAMVGAALLSSAAFPGYSECIPKHVAVRDIPKAALETLAFVRSHGQAPPGHVGGRRFGNYGGGGERKLPERDVRGNRVEYQEWDIYPKQPGRNRGAERLVTGTDGRAWYTADHYCSFTEMP